MSADNVDSLWTLNKWALNFRVHYKLPKNWEKNESRNYLLSPRQSEVTTFSCDERTLAVGEADGTVALLDVWRVPRLTGLLSPLLPGYRVLGLQVLSKYLVLLQSMLLQLYIREDNSYRLSDAKSFELGYSMIETYQKYDGRREDFGEWYAMQIGPDKYTKEKVSSTIIFQMVDDIVYVCVRDNTMIYGWSIESGKRVRTIHIPNRTCKLRDITINENQIYVIFASRNIRHITVYDITNEVFVYEITTPECKTQKLLVGEYLVGVAISGPGLTSPGVIKVWDKFNGCLVASRQTGYVSFKTVAALYDLVVYGEGTTVYLWEPRTDTLLRNMSLGEKVSFLMPCPFRFLLVVGSVSTHLWDWLFGNRLYRLHPKAVQTGDYRGLTYGDQTMLLLKIDSSVIEMRTFC